MTVVITGCSTGIGEACALRLDAAGWRVFAGVRREEDAGRLASRASGRLEPVIVDVTDAASIARASETVKARLAGARLTGLVNNAGIAIAAPLEHIPIDDFRRQLDVNVVGQLAVTQAFLPLLRAGPAGPAGRAGRIVLIGSIAGRLTVPFLGPYSASKFALEAMADALRVELQPWNLHVSLVEPGSIATPIWKKGAEQGNRMQSRLGPGVTEQYGVALDAIRRVAAATASRGIPADAVARVVEHALTSPSPKTRYLVGADARQRAWIAKLVPDRLRDALLTRVLGIPRRGAYHRDQ